MIVGLHQALSHRNVWLDLAFQGRPEAEISGKSPNTPRYGQLWGMSHGLTWVFHQDMFRAGPWAGEDGTRIVL